MTNPITVYGVDFTSSPTAKKPIVCIECRLSGDILQVVDEPWHKFGNFREFERFLATPPVGTHWIAGMDFPYSQSLTFIANMGWPRGWADYVGQCVEPLCRECWKRVLDNYKCHRKIRDKEHLRETDRIAGSKSPQKQVNPPVGLMFFEGAPRLLRAGVTIPGFQDGDPKRVAVEAYPRVAVHNLVGAQVKYNDDDPKKQTKKQEEHRKRILDRLVDGGAMDIYGVQVRGTRHHDILIEDPTGDHLDALLCAVQAAWAWRNGPPHFGLPAPICPTEGWIADPMPKQQPYTGRTANQELLKRITACPDVFGGKPIVRDMRISVELILTLLSQGAAADELLEDYPGLEPEDIRACIAYAHAVIARETLAEVSVAEP